ncbi:MAG TPA: DUF2059 domain-containing protein, partial [Steroidobacteraceae bacterium]|nr:DUF2059 domain-containing protein [Steroidobacteraceae bacterium]
MRIRTLAVLALLALQPAFAADAKPSEDSVRHLFEVMNTRHLLDDMMGQMDRTMRDSARQGLGAEQLNPHQQQIFDDMMAKLVAMMKDEMNWTAMEPLMLAVYRDTFTQHEVDAMAAFYSSAAGRSIATKLPLVTQRSMQMMQERMRGLIPRMVELEKDTAQQLRQA